MKTTHKGFSTTTVLIILAIIIVVLVVAFAFKPKATIAPDTSLGSNDQTASTTDGTVATSTDTPVATTPENPDLKTYANPTLGISFTYPRDFFIKTEGFDAKTGVWKLSMLGNRGEISAVVAKGSVPAVKETKLQTVAAKVGGKEATQFRSGNENGCDATVVDTMLDTEYALQLRFQTCGTVTDPIFKNTTDVNATLASVNFSNTNSRLLVLTKNGFVFRYPSVWTKPTQTTAGNVTTFTFGSDMTIQAGPEYSSTLKRNLSYNEVVTGAITTPNTVKQDITLGGKTAALLTTTPQTGAKKRTVYSTNKTSTDLIVITHTGVDIDSLNLVLNSFSFIK